MTILRERANGPKPGRRPVHLFTGFVHCSCGKKMYVPSNSPKWVCYECRNKVPVTDLESLFAGQLKSFVFSQEAISLHLGEVDAHIKAKRELRETLAREQEAVQEEQEKLYRLYLEGGLTVSGFRERNDPLEERKAQLATEVPRLQGEIDFLTIRQLSSSQVLSEAQSLYERWETLSATLKREVVETIVGRITVGSREVEIDLTCLPHAQSPSPHPLSSPELLADRERIHRVACTFVNPRRDGRFGRNWSGYVLRVARGRLRKGVEFFAWSTREGGSCVPLLPPHLASQLRT